jgi:hypothetical protein
MAWVSFLDRIYFSPSRRQQASVFQRVLLLLPAPQPMLLQRIWARTGE